MFNLKKIEGGRQNVHEPVMLTVGASELALQTVCILNDGVLVAATGKIKPTHVTLAKGEKGKTIPCGRINSNQVYETPVVGEAPTSLKVGQKVTLSGDGTGVTATTTDGVATIVDLLGATAEGDFIQVRF
jgi:hypothetical protein